MSAVSFKKPLLRFNPAHHPNTDESDKLGKPEAKKPAGGFGHPVRVIATTLALFLISQLIAALVIGLILGISRPGVPVDRILAGSAAAQFFYVLLAEGIAVGSMYLIISRRRLSLSKIGLGRRPVWRDLKTALAGFAIFYGLLIITTIIISYLIPSFDLDQVQDVGFDSLNSSFDKLIAFSALVVLAPIGEEILMRGYLYSGLRAAWNFLPALIATSLLFGLAHLEFGNDAPLVWVAAMNTFILSVVLVYVREKTAALYACMVIHMLNNSVAFLVHFA